MNFRKKIGRTSLHRLDKRHKLNGLKIKFKRILNFKPCGNNQEAIKLLKKKEGNRFRKEKYQSRPIMFSSKGQYKKGRSIMHDNANFTM